MIKEFTIQNFKSYSEAILPLAPLTLLIGANASGKSNALEAIRFLSWIAQGQKLSFLQYKINQTDQLLRGQVKDLVRYEESVFSLACKIDMVNLKIQIELWDGELNINRESCQINEKDIYVALPHVGDLLDVHYEFDLKENYSTVGSSNQQGVFTQLSTRSLSHDTHDIPSICRQLESSLAQITFVDPAPAKMRGYSFLTEKIIMGDGENLSSVLFHLWNNDNGSTETNRKDILAFISSLPEQDIQSLDFLHGPRGEIMVQLVETFGHKEHKTEAALLSDGTLRVLAFAAALLSAPEGGLIVIEEMDNGLHPNRAKVLLDSIDRIAQRRNLRILISSHNPALMDALPNSALPHVVFCYRDKVDGSSKLVRLQDVPDYPELMIQGSLGELVTQGLLDRFVKDYQGEEAKKEQALKWLASIK